MKRFCLAASTLLVAGLFAGFATAAGSSSSSATAPAVSSASGQLGTLYVGFAVSKFFVQGKTLFARGTKIATLTGLDGTQRVQRTPFVTPVKTSKGRVLASATRTCSVLNLNLGPTHLALLGLIVDLDKIVLTITANSEGGLLGGLLCGLAGGGGLLPGIGGAAPAPTPRTLSATASRLTQAAKTTGLAQGRGYLIPLEVTTTRRTASVQALPPVPAGVCTVLDLPLGPLDLNLLGLMVHLDATEVRITADPAGGLLGSLLCSLAGGAPTTPVPTPTTPTTTTTTTPGG
jgi:hypothetical protein